MERYSVHDEYMTPSEHGNVVLYADAQRALDAEREKVKELEAELEEYRSIAEQQGASKAVSQLATLQAQLRKPILVCQRCGRVSQDGWVPSRYECDELNGSLQCPDCQCIDLETNTAKELASICTQTQAQLRQVEGERDQWIAANTKEPINEPVTYQALAGARFVAKRAFDELVKARSDLSALRQLVEVHTKQLTELTIIPIGCSREQELRWTQSIKDLRATLAAQDAGKHHEVD